MNEIFTKINEKVNAIANDEPSLSSSECFLKASYESLGDLIDENELIFSHYDNDYYNMRVDGYDLVDEETITVFVVDYALSEEKLSENGLKSYIEQASNFILKSKRGLASKLDESSSVFELSNTISGSFSALKQFNIVILTNKLFLGKKVIEKKLENKLEKILVVDLSTLEELHTFDEEEMGEISIDFNNVFHKGLDFIKCENTEKEDKNRDQFDVYLFFMPGRELAELYGRYGYNLLEGNVRAYLKKTQKTNAGILDTITGKPNYFVSYNNGLSTVANGIEIKNNKIYSIDGWKIVNGGQTTATLYEAYKDPKVTMNHVMVPVKLTVIKHSNNSDLLISDIAKYANTQSKVNESDLSSNEKFYITMEKFSREVCVPQVIPGTELEKWFFERSRGQYNYEQSRAKKTSFKREFPNAKKFDKKLLAKAVMSWEQEPYTVSLGGEKNFITYNSRIRSNEGLFDFNEDYYKKCIGSIIIYKAIEKEVKLLKFGGYNNNITTYTLSVISSIAQYKMDLIKIWDDQGVDDEFKHIIRCIAKDVYKLITDTPDYNKNVAMYCRKEECWEKVKQHDFDLEVPENLVMDEECHLAKSTSKANVGTKLIDINSVTADEWVHISTWGKETQLIQPSERGMAYSMYNLLKNNRKPTKKQIDFAKSVLRDAYSNGFVYEKED